MTVSPLNFLLPRKTPLEFRIGIGAPLAVPTPTIATLIPSGTFKFRPPSVSSASVITRMLPNGRCSLFIKYWIDSCNAIDNPVPPRSKSSSFKVLSLASTKSISFVKGTILFCPSENTTTDT